MSSSSAAFAYSWLVNSPASAPSYSARCVREPSMVNPPVVLEQIVSPVSAIPGGTGCRVCEVQDLPTTIPGRVMHQQANSDLPYYTLPQDVILTKY